MAVIYKMKIISGGQTGVDQAALDAAIELGLEYGGSVPKGRLTEAGPLDPKYDRMTELKSASYSVRTEKNVVDSDATLILTMGKAGRGTALTIKYAKKHGKPYLHLDLGQDTEENVVRQAREWVSQVMPAVLNVAGSRESGAPGIYERAKRVLGVILRGYT